jgi:membrane fusion protein (multidrug efflux system)
MASGGVDVKQPNETETDQNDAKAVRKSPLSSQKVRWILALFAVLVVVLGVVLFVRHESYGRYQEETNDAFVQADMVTISPRVAGKIVAVFVKDNQEVHVGQPLIRIESTDFAARVAQAHAQVDEAVATVEGARASIREQNASIRQAEAQLGAAQIDLSNAQTETARYQPLVDSGAESGVQFSHLRADRDKATAQVRTMQAGLDLQHERMPGLSARLNEAVGRVKGAEAQVSSAEANLADTEILASIDGKVGNKSVQIGQMVQPGTRLMSIVPVQDIYVSANFKETQVGLMRVGQPVTVRADALPNAEITGAVESIAPGTGAQFSLLPPQNATGNFTRVVQRVPVRIRIDADPGVRQALIPGLSVTVSVDTRSAKEPAR